eukprot:2268104-Amphidinium_carterae.1
MPATGISVTCTMDNHIWFPLATWHLEEVVSYDVWPKPQTPENEVSAWQELLKGPVQVAYDMVGVLKPSVVVRCHGFGNPHRTLRLPAETHKKASCGALTYILTVCRFNINNNLPAPALRRLRQVQSAVQLPFSWMFQRCAEASLALFREELQLDGNDAVRFAQPYMIMCLPCFSSSACLRAFSVLDLWLMAQLEVCACTEKGTDEWSRVWDYLKVRVMTRCCLSGRFKGIEGAVIRVTEVRSLKTVCQMPLELEAFLELDYVQEVLSQNFLPPAPWQKLDFTRRDFDGVAFAKL